ncbi:MAG TPA: heavy metal translocating P-type ATPase [Bacillota bacterium]|mgnify:FL=1|nr:heavy metal translocating P-type ATPase [Bacillota bacterium]HOK69420.1 heavy metal translocating P-type ATPase [Bacillota bacterium]HPP86034.1 heavy metal translocating P-type ATPase [Bacillota bacterium]
MNKKQKRLLYRIIVSAVFFAAAMIFRFEKEIELILFLVSYLAVGGSILLKAAKNIYYGQVFNENLLMAIASVGAFIIGEYPEGAAVMLFYQVGELFEKIALDRSRKSIKALMNIRPDYANIEKDGQIIEVSPEEVKVGDTILVKAGEKVPLDGIVEKGASTLDTSSLTGESVPKDALEGDAVLSGCINISRPLYIKVTRPFEESTVAKILELVEKSEEKKARAENFITRFAKYYTPAVVSAALLLAVVPPLVANGDWNDWVYRALAFLVTSCPCALVISIPLSFFGGIGGASRNGILIKGGNFIEALSKADIVVFDKTGTLTKGVFKVSGIYAQNIESADLLEIAALAECYSNHPISQSLKAAYGKPVDTTRVANAEETAGFGVLAEVDGKTVLAGNEKLMRKYGIAFRQPQNVGTAVHVARDGVYLGYIVIADEVKPDSAETIRALKANGIRKTVMLTGDVKEAGDYYANLLGMDEVYSGLLPAGKVEQVEKLLEEKEKNKTLVFVGDGMNDTPVLTRADVGIAMGGLGTDAAIEAADVVLMDDQPKKVLSAIQLSRKTMRIVKENILFALGVKLLVLLLAGVGVADMWEAVFADVGVSIIAILNALRALKISKR